jgi:hypothetical protein
VKRGTHAAGDGSFGRSAGTAGLRGLVLLAAAVGIGVVLLNRADTVPTAVSNVRTVGSPTTAKPAKHGATTTTRPVTSTTTPPRAPQDIKVLVANGTHVQRQGARYTNVVHALGYNALSAVDATVQAPASVVYFAPGYAAEAAVLAAALHLPPTKAQPMPTPAPVVNLNGASLLVVVGPDLANAPTTPGTATTLPTQTTVRQAPATTAPPKTTTTTAHP